MVYLKASHLGFLVKPPSGLDEYLAPTWFIDAGNPAVMAKASEIVQGLDSSDSVGLATRLFYFVRDKIPYKIIWGLPTRKYLRASVTLERGDGFCIAKASLLAALARVLGIPSRLHFADIINHLAPKKLTDAMGSNVMVFHGYTEFFLAGHWLKVNPAFDLPLAEDKGYHPVDFDGTHDAVFKETDRLGNPHFEYVRDRGTRPDVPFKEIIDAWTDAYGKSFYQGAFSRPSP